LLSGSARADIQDDVDALHAELVALVARNRDMSAEAVGATEAAIYRGRRAVDVGFADRLGTLGQALAELAESLASSRPRLIAPRRSGAASPQPPRRTSAMTTDTTRNAPADIDPAAAPETPETEPVTPAQPAVIVQPAQPDASASVTAPSGDAAEQLRAEFSVSPSMRPRRCGRASSPTHCVARCSTRSGHVPRQARSLRSRRRRRQPATVPSCAGRASALRQPAIDDEEVSHACADDGAHAGRPA
jgi:hypothetical protein